MFLRVKVVNGAHREELVTLNTNHIVSIVSEFITIVKTYETPWERTEEEVKITMVNGESYKVNKTMDELVTLLQ
jgi:hypothetical protein